MLHVCIGNAAGSNVAQNTDTAVSIFCFADLSIIIIIIIVVVIVIMCILYNKI